MENKINLPVPVYLRPLDQKDASMKVKKSLTYIQLNICEENKVFITDSVL